MSHLESIFDRRSLASAKRVKVGSRPGEKIARLGANGCFGELFEDVWECWRDLDLLGAVHGLFGGQWHSATSVCN